jgi:tyrosine-protein kinase Etk/Wzc
MKNYLKRLKRELVIFLISGLIIATIAAFLYLSFGSPVVYITSAELTFSVAGQNIFKKAGFADEPEKIFNDENLKLLSKEQRQNIEFNLSADYKNLSIQVQGKDPVFIYRAANIIAEAYKAKIDIEGRDYIDSKQKEKIKEIDNLHKNLKDCEGQVIDVNEKLNTLEPQLEALIRQQETTESLRISFKERITNLELKKAELLRIYTESHPGVMGINSELSSLKEKLESLPAIEGISSLKRELEEQQAKYNELQNRIAQLKKQEGSLYEALKQPLEEPLAVISSYATRPPKPIGDVDARDIYKRFILSGIFLGLVISLVVAAIKDTIVSEFEISNIPGLPLVATVPFVKSKKGQKAKAITVNKRNIGTNLILSYDDSSDYVNAYRGLETHIKLDAFKGSIDKKVMLISSPNAKGGKSTVSANLAIILARLGKKVILLDANLNRTSVTKFFGIRARVSGVSDILSGKAKIDDCLKDVTDMLLGGFDWDMAMKTYGFYGLDRLKIIPSGAKVPSPANLLESGAVTEFFKELRNTFDCIIVDSPALLKSPDSIVLSPNADGIFLVCKTNSTSYKDIIKCSKKLAEIKIQFKGIILVCT